MNLATGPILRWSAVSSSRWTTASVAILLAAISVGWLDPHATAREGNRLFGDGKYGEAEEKYNQALVDHPDSPALHFNLGDAAYKQGKYAEAVNSFQSVPLSEQQPARVAHAAYNLGNAKYRLGEAVEASDPQAALASYGEALAAYRRAMGTAPDDPDIKFNYEFVEKKLADLKKKIEEQQQQQEQQPGEDQQAADNQQQQPQPEQQPQDDQQGEQQPQQQEQQADQQEKSQEAAGGAQEQTEDEISQQEAVAVLDSELGQEVQPDEIVKKLQGAIVTEPAKDW